MKRMLESSIGRLRLVGMAEGISLLVLLGIAMPLKYIADSPGMVKYVGWAHGVLFIAYIIMVLFAYHERNWPLKKVIFAFIAAFLPFGTFVFDAQLKKETGTLIS
jgi:integral membrane protein